MTQFKVGDTITARYSYAFRITKGADYQVVDVTPEHYVESACFRFPEYVTIIDDFKEKSTFHTHHFILKHSAEN